jgi:MoxR-like ATPase
MRVVVHSVLYRKITPSNAGALLGDNRGEHDLRLGRLPEIAVFTAGIPQIQPTALGGWTKLLRVEPFDGAMPVPARDLRLRYMGPGGARAQDTYIARQTSDPYPLWQPQRTHPGAVVAANLVGDVALVIKDAEGRFHARWVRSTDIPALPAGLRAAIDRHEKGVYTVPDTGAVSPQVAELIDSLHRHHNVLLYGPPGTGKTHLVTEVQRHFARSGLVLNTEAETDSLSESGGGDVRRAWATFHQSYSYEDFLIGLRPRPLPAGGFDLVPHPGILLELAEWARGPGRSSLLVIDEINRGNVSRIFGEFITLMEPDKRLDDAGQATDQTVEVRLPFIDRDTQVQVDLSTTEKVTVPVPFTMPRRVYTLATMNSVDKSVAPLDAALRRRFHVVNVSPRLQQFRAHLSLDDRSLTKDLIPRDPGTLEDARWLGLSLLQVLNERITLFLGPDFQLGEWFLAELVLAGDDAEGLSALADIWRTKLMPQLEDYFVGRSDQLRKALGEPRDDEVALVVDTPDADFAELGAVQALRARPEADDAALLRFMATMVRGALPAPSRDETDIAPTGADQDVETA